MKDSHARTNKAFGLMDDLIMALRFFSRLPTGGSTHQTPDLNRIAVSLPLASVIIAIGPALLLVGSVLVGLPVYFAVSLAVGAQIVVSGAMADDALADAADGLFGGHTIERRLDIMKDSRHGTYGVAALVLFILLRVTALAAIAALNPVTAGAMWLAAGIASRSSALWLAVALPAARSHGAAATAGRLGTAQFGIGLAFAIVLLMILVVPFAGLIGIITAVIAAIAVVVAWTALCRRLVGGQTGDLIGASGALVEIAVLGTLLLFL